MINKRHSLYCIIPPHVLEEIITRGSPNQRSRALQTLTVSEQVRGQRQVRTQLGSAGIVTPPEEHRAVYNAQNGDTLPGQLVREEGSSAVGDCRSSA